MHEHRRKSSHFACRLSSRTHTTRFTPINAPLTSLHAASGLHDDASKAAGPCGPSSSRFRRQASAYIHTHDTHAHTRLSEDEQSTEPACVWPDERTQSLRSRGWTPYQPPVAAEASACGAGVKQSGPVAGEGPAVWRILADSKLRRERERVAVPGLESGPARDRGIGQHPDHDGLALGEVASARERHGELGRYLGVQRRDAAGGSASTRRSGESVCEVEPTQTSVGLVLPGVHPPQDIEIMACAAGWVRAADGRAELLGARSAPGSGAQSCCERGKDASERRRATILGPAEVVEPPTEAWGRGYERGGRDMQLCAMVRG